MLDFFSVRLKEGMRDESDKIIELIDEKNSFLVIAHEKPDGDSLGSTLAITEILEFMGKTVYPVCKDTPPKVFNFLPNLDKISRGMPSISRIECAIVLDGVSRMTGFSETHPWFFEYFESIIEIDHHRRDFDDFHTHFHSESASSVCELIWLLAKKINFEITPKIATQLLTGIYTDTNRFINDNVTIQTLEATADLIDSGGDINPVVELLNQKTPGFLRTLGIVLRRLKLSKDGNIASTFMNFDDFDKLQVTDDDIAGISNFLSTTEEANVTMFLSERNRGKIKGSLRSRSEADVSKMAKLFSPHGGGHKKAAGFSLPGTFAQKDGEWIIEGV